MYAAGVSSGLFVRTAGIVPYTALAGPNGTEDYSYFVVLCVFVSVCIYELNFNVSLWFGLPIFPPCCFFCLFFINLSFKNKFSSSKKHPKGVIKICVPQNKSQTHQGILFWRCFS